jgi:hypothetical protein
MIAFTEYASEPILDADPPLKGSKLWAPIRGQTI